MGTPMYLPSSTQAQENLCYTPSTRPFRGVLGSVFLPTPHPKYQVMSANQARRKSVFSLLTAFTLGLALCSSTHAQDDVDLHALDGSTAQDQKYDSSGTLVQVHSIFRSYGSPPPPDLIVIQSSTDHGQSWKTLYKGTVKGPKGVVAKIHTVSIDLASDITYAPINSQAFVSVAGLVDTKNGLEHFVGVLKGPYTQPWSTGTSCAPVEVFSPSGLGSLGARASIAVIPNRKRSDYIIAVAHNDVFMRWTAFGQVSAFNIFLSYSMDRGQTFQWTNSHELTGANAELQGLQGDSFNRPSLVYDFVNENWVLAFDVELDAPGAAPDRDVVVCRAPAFLHASCGALPQVCYVGRQSQTGFKGQQHHPMLATNNNIVVFTCLTGDPNPVDGSYGLAAFWGNPYWTPWQQAFQKVDIPYGTIGNFHDRAITAGDLEMRGNKMHFAATCVVDPAGKNPGLGVLQFEADYRKPEEYRVDAINDHPVLPYYPPAVALTTNGSGKKYESILYLDERRRAWLDE